MGFLKLKRTCKWDVSCQCGLYLPGERFVYHPGAMGSGSSSNARRWLCDASAAELSQAAQGKEGRCGTCGIPQVCRFALRHAVPLCPSRMLVNSYSSSVSHGSCEQSNASNPPITLRPSASTPTCRRFATKQCGHWPHSPPSHTTFKVLWSCVKSTIEQP